MIPILGMRIPQLSEMYGQNYTFKIVKLKKLPVLIEPADAPIRPIRKTAIEYSTSGFGRFLIALSAYGDRLGMWPRRFHVAVSNHAS
jgi:hypothetical protein